jgi:hypothetical protein
MSSGILIDSCIIINHWRTPNHDCSILSQIRRKYNYIYISVITEYGIRTTERNDQIIRRILE